jgi:hypothetical protein
MACRLPTDILQACIIVVHSAESFGKRDCFFRYRNVMDVVMHEIVANHLNSILAEVLLQKLEISISIRIGEKDSLFLITALSNVVGASGNYYAGYSRHQQLCFAGAHIISGKLGIA